MKAFDKKKAYLVLVWLMFFSATDSLSQTLRGKYQMFSNMVTSAYHDVYEFNENHFKFIPTGYNGLGAVREIRGQYKLVNTDSIYFYVKEVEIFRIQGVNRIPWSPNNNSWTVILDEKNLTTLIIQNITESASYKVTKAENGKVVSFRIGNDEFFKIEE